jgi:uncharacterized protein (TIGR00156 family)
MASVLSRKLLNPILALSAGLILVTGLLLLFSLDPHVVEKIHEWSGILFISVCAAHIFLNRNSLIKTLDRRAFIETLNKENRATLLGNRQFWTPLLVVSGGSVLITGLFLFFGLCFFEEIHKWSSIVFIPACAAHIFLNRKPLLNTLNIRSIVMALVVVILLSSLVMFFSPGHRRQMASSGFTQSFAAGDKEGRRQGGGYGSPNRSVVSVEQAKGMRDDANVTLRGNIIQSLGGKYYLFQDATGIITVEISNKRWQGRNITPDDLVEISGKVDRERFRVKIEVKKISKQ